MRIVFLIILSVFVFSLPLYTGCGSSSEPEKGKKSGRVRKNLEEKTGVKEKKPEPEPAPEEVAPPEDTEPEESVEAEPVYILPEDVSKWVQSDFLLAKAERHKLFGDGIDLLANLAAQNDEGALEAVETLALLLERSRIPEEEISPAEEPAEGGEGGKTDESGDEKSAEDAKDAEDAEDAEEEVDSEDSSAQNTEEQQEEKPAEKPEEIILTQLSASQIKTCLDGILSNNSPEAEAILRKIIAGEILTDDDKTVVATILEAITLRASDAPLGENDEKWLFQLMTTPWSIRAELTPTSDGTPTRGAVSMGAGAQNEIVELPSGKRVRIRYSGGPGRFSSPTIADVQSKIFDKYSMNASPQFRLWVAEFLLNPDAAYESDEKLQNFALRLLNYVLSKDTRNALGQLALYKSESLDAANVQKLEEVLLACSRNIFCVRFGILTDKALEDYRAALIEKRAKDADAAELAAEEKKDGKKASFLGKLSQEKTSQGVVQRDRSTRAQSQRVDSDLTYLLMHPAFAQELQNEFASKDIRTLLRKRVQKSLTPIVALFGEEDAAPGDIRAPRLQAKDLTPIEILLSIPHERTRAQVRYYMEKGWFLGPQVFQEAFFDKKGVEPGLLMVAKYMERRTAPKESTKKKTSSGKQPTAAALKREQQGQAAEAWMNQTYNMVCRTCSDFSQAAVAQARLELIQNEKAPPSAATEDSADDASSGEDSTEGLAVSPLMAPLEFKLDEELAQRFPLPEDARVTRLYSLPKGEDGLSVTYIEVECTARRASVLGPLKSRNSGIVERGEFKQTKSAEVRGFWLERWTLDKESGQRESLDILVASTDPPAGRASGRESASKSKNPPENLRICILLMEMPELSTSRSAKKED